MFGDLYQGTVPTEHQATLATRVCSSPAGPLGVFQDMWESCGHILMAAAGNVWLWSM